MRLFSLFLLVSFLLSACNSLIQDVDPDKLPKVDQKIVVQCYISPQDTLLRATVSQSRVVLGTNDNSVTNGHQVVLSEGSRSIELKFNPSLSAFVADARQFPIEAGKTYRLKVQKGVQSVEAVCTVPQAIPLTTVKLDSARLGNDRDGSLFWSYYIQASWQDPAGSVNMYRLAGDYEFLQVTTSTRPNQPPTQNSQQMINQLGFNEDNTDFLSDRNRNGQMITSQRGYLYLNSQTYSYVSNGSVYTNSTISKRPIKINFYLLNVDMNYHAYHHALELQNDAVDNPFAEPALVPTNIQGGLGCFGAYNRSTITAILK
ncbi:DUF4249 domain-containing protein [Larkinella punicea]|uniref:DUF4249 domain-containing protein n=1 Tax=Larkinella punicea TaxID=2315727 RepID=A0A368JM73_9BACT|nr:DUF4249 domain-containing protein [Larkinella punicea]RCR68747.1 DUF4249 domain-containing protein [Larkinella punicea]